MIYGHMINFFMFVLMVIGFVQGRAELVIGGVILGFCGIFWMLVMGRLEFGEWKWWRTDEW